MTDPLPPLTSADLADLKAKAKAASVKLGFAITSPNTLTRLIATIERRDTALTVIRDMPIPEQDNMIAANMREIACKALAATEPSNG